MIKENRNEKNYAKSYIISVLLMTTLVSIILFINPNVGLQYFGLVGMAIPTILAIVFNNLQGKTREEKNRCLRNKLNLKSVVFGTLYPICFIIFCAFIAYIIGIGKLNSSGNFVIKPLTIGTLLGALGEEYGWRGYLLPELTKTKGKLRATLIVGVVWGLFHVPMVFLLAKTTGINNPLLLCVIQACAAFTYNFPSCYCYFMSENIIPVILLHGIWNVINPSVLGDIYTNEQGILEGNLLYINGEALLGTILGTILIYWFVKQLRINNIAKHGVGPAKSTLES